jgi:hypothetical protein
MKPKIIFLADKKDWAFSFVAQEIIKRLKSNFNFKLYHINSDKPNLS